jgi:hypothetical protein
VIPPHFSVIITCHNQASFIQDAVADELARSYKEQDALSLIATGLRRIAALNRARVSPLRASWRPRMGPSRNSWRT